MTCPACGATNDDAAEMCFTCGRALFGLTQGAVVGERYLIQESLGKGGMGMVYKARDRKLDEIVAIKILRPGFAADPDLEKRFLTEIKLARKVSHKNICRIHEYGEDKGLRYISMAYVEGVDLKRLVRENGPLPRQEAFDAAIQVALGLQAIHDEGIVHRDLKPANMIRDAKGVVRLLDFGIAKQVDATTTEGLTSTGVVVGTPDYISPEQALGKKADARSDIYSLGVVIFELFTGQVPFRGDSAFNTLQKHVHEPPPLEGVTASNIPKNVVPILRKALAKDPSLRHQTARELSEALERASEPRGSGRTTVVPGAGTTLSQAATRAAATPGPRSLRPTLRSEMPALASPAPKQESGSSLGIWLPVLAFGVLLSMSMTRGPGRAQPSAGPTPAVTVSADVNAPAARVEILLPTRAAAPTTPPQMPVESEPRVDPAAEPVTPQDAPVARPLRQEPAAPADPRAEARENCDRGQSQACFELGEMLRSGHGGPRDLERAALAFEHACDRGVAKGCAAAGFLYLTGQGVAEDRARGARLLQQACDEREVQACTLVEQMKRREQGRRPGPPRP